MHDDSFDYLTRRLSAHRTRRTSLGLLLGLVALLGLAPVPLTEDGALAKKKKGKAKKKKAPARQPVLPVGCPSGLKACQSGCIPSSQCCTTSECPGGMLCQNAGCACPPGTLLCPPVSNTSCCTLPPDLLVNRMDCGSLGEPPLPACVCELRPIDVCAPGCTDERVLAVNCADPRVDILPSWCQEAGCEPPLEVTPPPPG